jgi:VIT1/CCC1 family predicted Fe2+/Mn2+ transporter
LLIPLIFSLQTVSYDFDEYRSDSGMSKGTGLSFFSRIKDSLRASSGEIVFGMSDGVVSIFGLVLGVAAGAQSAGAVFLAGATGAIAASVSMMAGLYLDLESEKDEARVEDEQRDTEIQKDPAGAANELMGVLRETGLSDTSLAAIREDITRNPRVIRKFEDAVACEETPISQKVSPIVHACWMGLADFAAGITPVIPFALLPFDQARVVCIAGTALLLILLGIGRAKIGKRPATRTVLETMAIATAAAIAGVLIGLLIS